MRRWILLIALVSLVGGCAKARARTNPTEVALDAPPPPARVIVPPEPEPIVEQPSSEPESRTAKPARTRPVAPRPDARTEASRADRKTESGAAGDASRGATQPGALQPLLPTSPAALERQVRDLLVRARADLAKVDAGSLRGDGKTQFDTARRFVDQAEQALKDRNLVFAAKLAEKAAGLAATLLGR